MRDDELERLFKLYHTPLVRYLTRRLGDRDWADEVAQETFLRALRQDALTSERSWLFAVATNLVRDDARKDSRRAKRSPPAKIARAVSTAACWLSISPLAIRAMTSLTTSARTSGIVAASFFAAERFAVLRKWPDEFPCMTYPRFFDLERNFILRLSHYRICEQNFCVSWRKRQLPAVELRFMIGRNSRFVPRYMLSQLVMQ